MFVFVFLSKRVFVCKQHISQQYVASSLKRQRIVAKYICCLQTNTRLERKKADTNNHDENMRAMS